MNPELSLLPNRTTVAPQTWSARCRSIACRLLRGSGKAELAAYRLAQPLEFQVGAHQMADDGRLFVAIPLTEDLVGTHRYMDVRFTVEKQAPDPQIRVVSASLHLLGKATWLMEEEKQKLTESGILGDRICEISKFGHLARIDFDRALLHDCCGVTPFAASAIASEHIDHDAERDDKLFCDLQDDLFMHPELEITAAEAVSRSGVLNNHTIFDAMILGDISGAFITRQFVTDPNAYSLGTICLDVDRTGLTLMVVEGGKATTVFLPFAQPIATERQLEGELDRLVGWPI